MNGCEIDDLRSPSGDDLYRAEKSTINVNRKMNFFLLLILMKKLFFLILHSLSITLTKTNIPLFLFDIDGLLLDSMSLIGMHCSYIF